MAATPPPTAPGWPPCKTENRHGSIRFLDLTAGFGAKSGSIYVAVFGSVEMAVHNRSRSAVSGLEKVYFFGLWHVSCLLNIIILTEG